MGQTAGFQARQEESFLSSTWGFETKAYSNKKCEYMCKMCLGIYKGGSSKLWSSKCGTGMLI